MSAPEHARPRLSAQLRAQQGEILADWAQRVRRLEVARHLPEERLRDHLPHLLARLADLVETLEAGGTPSAEIEAADLHARDRLEVGFDLEEVVAEYTELREILVRRVFAAGVSAELPASVSLLDRAIDRAIAASVERYTLARDRSLRTFDEIATATLKSRSLEELLERLLEIFRTAVPAVDTASILLREGDWLCVRAGYGLEQEVREHFRLAIGEGFAGTIAQTRRPLGLRDAARSALVKSPALKAAGVKALFGVPLLEEGELLGVAHIGSRTVAEFFQLDRVLFQTLGARASAAIREQLLRDELREQHVRFADLVNALDHAVVWEMDPNNLEITFASQRAEPVLGVTAEEMCTSGFWGRHMPPEEHHKVRKAFDLARSERSSSLCEHRFQRRDGRTLMLQTGVFYSERAGRAYLNGLSTDVSQLYEAIGARDRVLSIVSHDLRTQLGNLVNSVRLLDRILPPDGRDPRLRHALEVSERAGDQMDRLIVDLLDVAALDAGKLSVVRGSVAAAALARDTSRAFEGSAQAAGVELVAEVDGAEDRVSCDRGRILQVLGNLVSNALKVTPRGGKVVVRVESAEGGARFAVCDTGPGIPPEEVAALFTAFRRGADVAYRGTGLGLWIARGIIEAHGGELRVESTVGRGSTFSFVLRADELQ